jgi:hypothetical protein
LSKLYEASNYIQEINDCTNKDQLGEIWKTMPKTAKNDLHVIEVFTNKKNELNGK